MFLITWIEGEEVNYRLIQPSDIPGFMTRIGSHVIMQQLSN